MKAVIENYTSGSVWKPRKAFLKFSSVLFLMFNIWMFNVCYNRARNLSNVGCKGSVETLTHPS